MFRFAVERVILLAVHNKDGTLKTVWSFYMLLESWWNRVLVSQTVLSVINVSGIIYATSTYSWCDNNTHCNELGKAHLEKEINDQQHVLAISTERNKSVVLVPLMGK